MKRICALLFMGVLLGTTSCKKYLDINTDPNRAGTATISPELLLPQALTATANIVNGYNTMGAQLGGFMANAGGYGGFGVSISYQFTTANFNGQFSGPYDNLEDYYTILQRTEGDPLGSYYNGAARIMKAMMFQLLVDAYNDVPYFEALTGEILTPKYDDATEIYKSLADELDMAIQTINTGDATSGVKLLGATDVLFGGDMVKWKQFANTIKLRLHVQGQGKVSFSNTTFSTDGFLTTDALVNPGYVKDAGKQNPKWATWAYSNTGSPGNKAWMPTTFALTFYNGVKLSDPGRGNAIYYNGTSTPDVTKVPTNRLGVESNGVVSSPDGSFWYPSTNRTGSSAGNASGVLKGSTAGMPILTAAESYFLQAEAAVRGIYAGGDDAATLFNKGILASFTYLYKKEDGTSIGNPTADVATYLAENAASRLANFALATTTEQKIEAIITQKYIAMNMVNSDVAWNDYRRTHYPTLNNAVSATGAETFASSVSESTRPDHLPTRILYPSAEGSYNGANVPKNISPFNSLIFWAQ